MNLKIVRQKNQKGFTEGKLYINEVFECYTVEDEDRLLESNGKKVQNRTAIPKGKYNVIISYSNRFKKHLLEVQNVDLFSGIRIHSGNSSKDTEGCIIVGAVNDRLDDDWVEASRVAYERLHNKVKTILSNKGKVTLEVT